MSRPLLVTGAAGFIGAAVAHRLLARGERVVGVDSLNDYYSVRLKEARLARLRGAGGFDFLRLDLSDREATAGMFDEVRPRAVVHLAAQAGVRHSIDNPAAYVDANLVGFANVLEGCRSVGAEHLVFASSSSVYGAGAVAPFRERDDTDRPVSLYAATKKANEAMAHSYAHLYGLPTTGLRFFTVYGPWGRPDMAYFLFADAIADGRPIRLFNGGRMLRDFTYIDDVAEGLVRTLDRPPAATHGAPYDVFNIGNDRPVEMTAFVSALEAAMGRTARIEPLPMQPGDVPTTHADVARLRDAVGFRPQTPLAEGLARFVAWHRDTWRPLLAAREGALAG